ncbi:MAG: hypothetical protein ACUVR0_08945 [Candidatus Aminicenantales bacterium]
MKKQRDLSNQKKFASVAYPKSNGTVNLKLKGAIVYNQIPNHEFFL